MTAFVRRSYDGGGATTTLSSNMGAADTSFVLTAATNWPGSSPAANFGVVIDRGTASEEKILCASNTGTTVVVASGGRGADGTSATTHTANATVSLCAFAQDFDEANQVSNLLGNAAAGSLIIGAGAATLPTKLAVGSAASVLTGGTTPGYVAASNGQYFGVSGGAVAAITPPTVTQLTPISKSSSYAATNGQFVNATATLTVTSPAAAAGAVFGAIANYGASNASPVTVTAASGNIIGPGIPGSTTSILLGLVNAYVTFVSDGTNWYMTGGAQDSGWVTPSLLNSWATAGVAPQYRLVANRVILRGSAQGGSSGTVMWNMPAAFRPPSGQNPQLFCYFDLGGVSGWPNPNINIVQTTGGVTPAWSSGTLSEILLDSCSYTVD